MGGGAGASLMLASAPQFQGLLLLGIAASGLAGPGSRCAPEDASALVGLVGESSPGWTYRPPTRAARPPAAT